MHRSSILEGRAISSRTHSNEKTSNEVDGHFCICVPMAMQLIYATLCETNQMSTNHTMKKKKSQKYFLLQLNPEQQINMSGSRHP